MEAIFTIGIFMSFFIAFLLLIKKNKALSDQILAIWVTVIGIHLLNYYLHQQGLKPMKSVSMISPLFHLPFLIAGINPFMLPFGHFKS